MKFIKSALAGIALCAASLSSHAGFTSSMSGPSQLRPGYSGTFEFTLRYTPIDLSLFGTSFNDLDGAIEYSYVQTRLSVAANFFKDGYQYDRTDGWLNVATSLNPLYSSFDQSQPATIRKSFTWVAGGLGSYEMVFGGGAHEQLWRSQTALCRATASCASWGQLNDLQDFSHGVTARFGIEVTPTAPIPEPQTYALMLAGLGIVSAIARRRKEKQG